eukprot:5032924-Pleurochrysis_carterae.AAC.1
MVQECLVVVRRVAIGEGGNGLGSEIGPSTLLGKNLVNNPPRAICIQDHANTTNARALRLRGRRLRRSSVRADRSCASGRRHNHKSELRAALKVKRGKAVKKERGTRKL